MTGGVALAVFGGAAVVDWVAVGRGFRGAEYVAKPAALAALIAYAAASSASAWLVAALALSLAGDVLLMLPFELFVPGLAAFLLAHVAYVAAFRSPALRTMVLLVPVAIVAVPLGSRVVGAIDERALRPPVIAYVAVISVMVASALAYGAVAAAWGAVLFMASDALIAWNRFVRRLAWAPVVIMVTYHLGQLGLVTALRGP